MLQRLNGCHNGQRGAALAAHTYPAQAGWIDLALPGKWAKEGAATRTPIVVAIPHVMTTDCQYSKGPEARHDPACKGCKWKAPEPCQKTS
jgi:hypothetical protein